MQLKILKTGQGLMTTAAHRKYDESAAEVRERVSANNCRQAAKESDEELHIENENCGITTSNGTHWSP
jgi:hypothetical protein